MPNVTQPRSGRPRIQCTPTQVCSRSWRPTTRAEALTWAPHVWKPEGDQLPTNQGSLSPEAAKCPWNSPGSLHLGALRRAYRETAPAVSQVGDAALARVTLSASNVRSPAHLERSATRSRLLVSAHKVTAHPHDFTALPPTSNMTRSSDLTFLYKEQSPWCQDPASWRVGISCSSFLRELPGWLSRKNPPASAGAAGDLGSIPGLGRSPGGGNGNLLQYSCWDNPTDRGAWPATVYGVAKSQTLLSNWACIRMPACSLCDLNQGIETPVPPGMFVKD